MPVCATCHLRPCRCRVELRAPDEVLETMLAVHAAAAALSPEYVAWLDGDGEDLEPELPRAVRERMLALVATMEKVIGG